MEIAPKRLFAVEERARMDGVWIWYWYWILRGRPERSPHLLKQKTVREYGERFGLKTLVETGTYYGEMVAAMKRRFRAAFTRLSLYRNWRNGRSGSSRVNRISRLLR